MREGAFTKEGAEKKDALQNALAPIRYPLLKALYVALKKNDILTFEQTLSELIDEELAVSFYAEHGKKHVFEDSAWKAKERRRMPMHNLEAFSQLLLKEQESTSSNKKSIWCYCLEDPSASWALWHLLDRASPQSAPKDTHCILLDILNSPLEEKKPLLEYAQQQGFEWKCSARELLRSIAIQGDSYAEEILRFAVKYPHKMNEEKFSKENVQKSAAFFLFSSGHTRLIARYIEAKEIANACVGEQRFDPQEWSALFASMYERLDSKRLHVLEEYTESVLVRTVKKILKEEGKSEAHLLRAMGLLDWVFEGYLRSAEKYEFVHGIVKKEVSSDLASRWVEKKVSSLLEFSQEDRPQDPKSLASIVDSLASCKIAWDRKDKNGIMLGEKVLYLWSPALCNQLMVLGFDIFLQQHREILLAKLKAVEVTNVLEEERLACIQMVEQLPKKIVGCKP